MLNGTYNDFRDALRAFESGWDRARYETGQIADWQLDQWAKGPVTDFFPQYSSWSQLSDAEWGAMSYRSMNTLGFVGYQFGEALLIDLGYYTDDLYYGNGAASNTWDGTWTGKNGVNSLEEFMTASAQEQAIQDAFGFNLQVIANGLANAGQSLNDLIGSTATYVENGQTVEVSLSLSGILAAAHLRGAWGTLNLLLNGSVSADEYGTSILKYVQQFGNYATPSVDEIIAVYADGATPVTPPNPTNPPTVPGDPGDGPTFGNPDAQATDGDVVIDWSWGTNTVRNGFDPATDTIFVAWIGADSLQISETSQGLVIAVPSNNQTVTIAGINLSDLSTSNFSVKDQTARDLIASLLDAAPSDTPEPGGPVETPPDLPTPPPEEVDVPPSQPLPPTDNGPSRGAPDTFQLTWNWGAQEIIEGFDPTQDSFDFGWLSARDVNIVETANDLVINVLNNGGHSYTIAGIQAEDLSADNLTAPDANAVLTGPSGVYAQLAELGAELALV